jgi:hypothetical protein
MRGRRCIQDAPGRLIGIEGLSLLDPNGLELIDHHPVAREPDVPLDDPIERLKVTQIVGNGGVVHDVDSVMENGIGRIPGLTV